MLLKVAIYRNGNMKLILIISRSNYMLSINCISVQLIGAAYYLGFDGFNEESRWKLWWRERCNNIVVAFVALFSSSSTVEVVYWAWSVSDRAWRMGSLLFVFTTFLSPSHHGPCEYHGREWNSSARSRVSGRHMQVNYAIDKFSLACSPLATVLVVVCVCVCVCFALSIFSHFNR